MEKKALIRAMKRSISEVFETMFFLPVEVSDRIEKNHLLHLGKEKLSTTRLRFSGPFLGSFFLLIPENFAASLAADFVGSDKQDMSQEKVTETTKEIINMLAGNTFAFLDDQAVFDLHIPESIPAEQAMASSGRDDEIMVNVDTMDNSFALKMAISR